MMKPTKRVRFKRFTFINTFLLVAFLLAFPAKAQLSTEEEINPPGNREAYEECLGTTATEEACFGRYSHRDPKYPASGLPETFIDREVCHNQLRERNISIVHYCERAGTVYDWEYSGGWVSRPVTFIPHGDLVELIESECAVREARLVTNRVCRLPQDGSISNVFGRTEGDLLIEILESSGSVPRMRRIQVRDLSNGSQVITDALFTFIEGIGGGGSWQAINVIGRDDTIRLLDEEIDYLAEYNR